MSEVTAIGTPGRNGGAGGGAVATRLDPGAPGAQSYFHDHAIDIGWLSSGALAGDTLTLQAVITVQTLAGSSGFYGDLLIGDPPSGYHAATANAPVPALADFHANDGGIATTPAHLAAFTDTGTSFLAASGFHRA